MGLWWSLLSVERGVFATFTSASGALVRDDRLQAGPAGIIGSVGRRVGEPLGHVRTGEAASRAEHSGTCSSRDGTSCALHGAFESGEAGAVRGVFWGL